MNLNFDLLADLLRTQASAGQPDTLLRRYGEICRELFGYKLLTVFAWAPERNEALRIFSTDPTNYPTNRWKPMGATAWGARVLKAGEPVLCRTVEDMKWAYPDHELLLKLDCIASMSAPVMHDGMVIGSSSINDTSDAYTASQMKDFAILVQCLCPVLLNRPATA